MIVVVPPNKPWMVGSCHYPSYSMKTIHSILVVNKTSRHWSHERSG
jgi:hypothetical protein